MRKLKEAPNFMTETVPQIKEGLNAVLNNVEEQNVLLVLSVANGRCACDMLMGNAIDIDELFVNLERSNKQIFDVIARAVKGVKKFKKFKKKKMSGFPDSARAAFEAMERLNRGMDRNDNREVLSDQFGALIDKDPKFFMIAQHRMIELFESKGIPTPSGIKDATNGKELMDAFKGAEDIFNKF